MLIWLADSHPEAGLAPRPQDPQRAAFLRWMVFIPANIYPMYTLKDRPERWFDDPAAQAQLVDTAVARIRQMWRAMEAQTAPAPHILGAAISVLDVYAAVVSRWTPRRRVFRADCPRLAAAVERVDAEPRLQALWAERFPFEPGWDVMG
jgi:GST-like protein